jgi:predicted heme/steroid binding protein
MLKKNRWIVLSFLLVLMLTLVACSPEAPAEDAPESEAPPAVEENGEELEVFDLETLATFDGKDGRPAYVAVDGVVYDVTDLDAWSGGSHNGNEAGQDLTEEIKNESPHGVSVLSQAEVVGNLEE